MSGSLELFLLVPICHLGCGPAPLRSGSTVPHTAHCHAPWSPSLLGFPSPEANSDLSPGIPSPELTRGCSGQGTELKLVIGTVMAAEVALPTGCEWGTDFQHETQESSFRKPQYVQYKSGAFPTFLLPVSFFPSQDTVSWFWNTLRGVIHGFLSIELLVSSLTTQGKC